MSFSFPTDFISPNEIVKCDKLTDDFSTQEPCGWEGKISQTIKKTYCSDAHSWRSLCGRQGVNYLCPNCKRVLKNIIIRLS